MLNALGLIVANAKNYYVPNVDARESGYLPQVVVLLSVTRVALRWKYNRERAKNVSRAVVKMRQRGDSVRQFLCF